MTQTKDPAVHEASARRAVVQGEIWVTPEQLTLPLIPESEGKPDLRLAGRDGGAAPDKQARRRNLGSGASSSEEEKLEGDLLDRSAEPFGERRPNTTTGRKWAGAVSPAPDLAALVRALARASAARDLRAPAGGSAA